MMVKAALETGWIEGAGPYYPQPRAPIRPAPSRSFADRLYAVASSDDSVEAAARLRARHDDVRRPLVEEPQAERRPLARAVPDVPRRGAAAAADLRLRLLRGRCRRGCRAGHPVHGAYLESVLEHYEIMGDHFEGLKGYDAYAGAATVLKRMGESGFMKGFLEATASGTPEQILETYRARYELLGGFEAAPAFRFGGIPFEEAEAGMRLFAAEVLPELQSWT